MSNEAIRARAIVRDPNILDGEPTVAGTRVPVRSVVLMQRIYEDNKRVQRALPSLTEADIMAALQYFRDHQAEIDGYIHANEVDEELLREHT